MVSKDDILQILKRELPYYEAHDKDAYLYIAKAADVERTADAIMYFLELQLSYKTPLSD